MVSQQPNSACCQAPIQRFGGRRRRCRACGRTWRVYPHRRGRKRVRPTAHVVIRTIAERRPLGTQRGASLAARRKRFQTALRWWLAHTRPPAIPPGPLVLLIDGVWCRFGSHDWTLYLIAFKPLGESRAYFVDPPLLPGREAGLTWHAVLQELGPDVLRRVVAVVTDGFRGSHTLARHHNWLHQRCHFHLVAQLQQRRGRHLQLPGAGAKQTVYEAVRAAVVTDSPQILRRLQRQLRRALADPACRGRVRLIVGGILRHLDAFRTYRRYPQLDLPTTTNVVESMARRIRDRIRTLRTPAAVQRWAVAIIRLRPSLKCNGRLYQPN